ncbi:MAG: c-type cytochrome [Candidatus Promineifilaceae bacterium]
MRQTRSIILLLLTVLIWVAVGCDSPVPNRQEQIAESGSAVMPFDLQRTTHIFQKLDTGGVQQVVSDDGDAEQVALIRDHLAGEAERFRQGDFQDPALIHGEDMAGLRELAEGADRLTIQYNHLENGGQIVFATEDGELVTALHAWFDQQVADHGDHALAVGPETAAAAANEPDTVVGTGMGMMGNNSMGTAHHAAIPETYAALSNPVTADDASLERGAEVYSSSCAVCHGDGGMGDGPGAANLDPAVSPIAHTSQMLSDAYLFWRISEGGQGDPLTSAMPSWKSILDEQTRWDVINYVQALGQGSVMPRHAMGGVVFDPAIEQQNRLEMLAAALDAGLIAQDEADNFDEVHAVLDSLMEETGLRMQSNNLPALLAILVERDEIAQEQADTFAAVHNILLEAGMMR